MVKGQIFLWVCVTHVVGGRQVDALSVYEEVMAHEEVRHEGIPQLPGGSVKQEKRGPRIDEGGKRIQVAFVPRDNNGLDTGAYAAQGTRAGAVGGRRPRTSRCLGGEGYISSQ